MLSRERRIYSDENSQLDGNYLLEKALAYIERLGWFKFEYLKATMPKSDGKRCEFLLKHSPFGLPGVEHVRTPLFGRVENADAKRTIGKRLKIICTYMMQRVEAPHTRVIIMKVVDVKTLTVHRFLRAFDGPYNEEVSTAGAELDCILVSYSLALNHAISFERIMDIDPPRGSIPGFTVDEVFVRPKCV